MKPTDDHKIIEKFEHDSWERCAQNYTDGFGALVGMSIPSLLDAAGVNVDSHVLDIGTGPGLVAAAVHDRRGTAIGIDFSESMIAEARRQYSEIDFQHANAESLPFKASKFDAIVSNFVFHHLASPEVVLSEAYRVLRDGGKIAFTVWSDRSKLAGFRLFLDAMENHAEAVELPHGPLYGVSDFNLFREMMQKAGFHDVTIIDLDITWKISSIESYLEVFKAWGNLYELTDSIRTAVEMEVRESAQQLESGGTLELSNPAVLVSAVK